MLEIFLQNVFLVQILNTTVSILKFSYKMQENFLHTSVKLCTSAGKFPAHTVKIWIFLSSAGNMIPALQPLNTGALSHGLSFLISFGTCLWTRSRSTWANFMLKSLRDPDNSAMYKYHFVAGRKQQDSIVVTSHKLCLDSLQQIVVTS